jgi:RNA polymerase II subunit A-like phosphatase
MFGAICHTNLANQVTHLVAAKSGTAKVDQAFKRGDVKVVNDRWFRDCVSKWQRLPETGDYLVIPNVARIAAMARENALRPPLPLPPEVGPSKDAGPVAPVITISTAVDTTPEVPTPAQGDPDLGSVEPELSPMDDVDWNAAEAELEEWMNESGDDGDSKSEDDWDEPSERSSAAGTPRRNRKRQRSVTPSTPQTPIDDDDDMTRSPLSKRKKLLETRGNSGLKVDISRHVLDKLKDADDINMEEKNEDTSTEGGNSGDEVDDDDDDDFLARDLDS